MTAISNHVMRTGKHYVTFYVSGEHDLTDPTLDFGVIRPIKGWDKKGLDSFDAICFVPDHLKYRKPLLAEKTEEWGDELHCCIYHSYNGVCFHANWCDEDQGQGDGWEGDDWEGMEPVGDIDNFNVGLLLDLNTGTLSVFKDGRMLGVMKEGLTGAYCWYFCGIDITCDVTIERGNPPATRND